MAGGKLELFDCGKIVGLDDGLGVGVQKFRSDPGLTHLTANMEQHHSLAGASCRVLDSRNFLFCLIHINPNIVLF